MVTGLLELTICCFSLSRGESVSRNNVRHHSGSCRGSGCSSSRSCSTCWWSISATVSVCLVVVGVAVVMVVLHHGLHVIALHVVILSSSHGSSWKCGRCSWLSVSNHEGLSSCVMVVVMVWMLAQMLGVLDHRVAIYVIGRHYWNGWGSGFRFDHHGRLTCSHCCSGRKYIGYGMRWWPTTNRL